MTVRETYFLRSIIFLSKEELRKEVEMTKIERYKHIFRPYLVLRIPITLIIYIVEKHKMFWVLWTTFSRFIFIKEVRLSCIESETLVLDHSSNKFIDFYLNSPKAKKIGFRGFISIKFIRGIFSKYGFIKNILNNNSFNPEILGRFLFSYLLFKDKLDPKRHKKIIINDDLMPTDLGLLTAASELNIKTAVFRITDALNRPNPPFYVDELHFMSPLQNMRNIRARKRIITPKTHYKLKEVPACGPIKVGMPLTSKYNLVENFNLESILRKIDSIISAREIILILRPHPQSNILKLEEELESLKNIFKLNASISHDERLIDFAKNIDIVISGNSSAAKDLLDLGIPVMYRDDLDFSNFDSHGWVKLKVFYHFSGFKLDLDNMIEFYSKKN